MDMFEGVDRNRNMMIAAAVVVVILVIIYASASAAVFLDRAGAAGRNIFLT
jgi:hypothetical protein